MDRLEIDRLAGKIVSDTKRKRGTKRYPWEFLNVLARHWIEADKEPGAGTIDTGAGLSGSTIDEDANEVAGKLSDAQRRALREVARDRTTGASVATVGALENKALIAQVDNGEFNLTDLGKAVHGLLAREAE